MGEWLSQHAEAVMMFAGGVVGLVSLLWRGAVNTQQVLHRIDTVDHRLERVEKSVEIASKSREKLHNRIDRLAETSDAKLGEVRERVVVLETRAGARG